MYSPSSTTTEITNSGGLTHCFSDSLTEHLSGINTENQEFSDIKLGLSHHHNSKMISFPLEHSLRIPFPAAFLQ